MTAYSKQRSPVEISWIWWVCCPLSRYPGIALSLSWALCLFVVVLKWVDYLVWFMSDLVISSPSNLKEFDIPWPVLLPLPWCDLLMWRICPSVLMCRLLYFAHSMRRYSTASVVLFSLSAIESHKFWTFYRVRTNKNGQKKTLFPPIFSSCIPSKTPLNMIFC